MTAAVGGSFKLFSLLVLGVVSLLMSAYSLIGVLQAGAFAGERALRRRGGIPLGSGNLCRAARAAGQRQAQQSEATKIA